MQPHSFWSQTLSWCLRWTLVSETVWLIFVVLSLGIASLSRAVRAKSKDKYRKGEKREERIKGKKGAMKRSEFLWDLFSCCLYSALKALHKVEHLTVMGCWMDSPYFPFYTYLFYPPLPCHILLLPFFCSQSVPVQGKTLYFLGGSLPLTLMIWSIKIWVSDLKDFFTLNSRHLSAGHNHWACTSGMKELFFSGSYDDSPPTPIFEQKCSFVWRCQRMWSSVTLCIVQFAERLRGSDLKWDLTLVFAKLIWWIWMYSCVCFIFSCIPSTIKQIRQQIKV